MLLAKRTYLVTANVVQFLLNEILKQECTACYRSRLLNSTWLFFYILFGGGGGVWTRKTHPAGHGLASHSLCLSLSVWLLLRAIISSVECVCVCVCVCVVRAGGLHWPSVTITDRARFIHHSSSIIDHRSSIWRRASSNRCACEQRPAVNCVAELVTLHDSRVSTQCTVQYACLRSRSENIRNLWL